MKKSKYMYTGWRCPSCRRKCAVKGKCPKCGTKVRSLMEWREIKR